MSIADRHQAATAAGRPAPSVLRTGLALASGVLGVGLIMSAPITAGLAGDIGWLAWLAHLVIGGLFSFAAGLLALSRGPVTGLADLVGSAWGSTGSRTVTALYLGGFIVGQAAIALTAGRLIGYTLGLTGVSALSDEVAAGIAASVVAIAAGLNLGRYRLPDVARQWRVPAALVLGLALSANPAALRGSLMLPAVGGTAFWPAVFLLLFAGVGWERSAALASSLRGARSLGVAVLVGWSMVSAAYLLVGAVADTVGRGSQPSWAPGLSRTVAGLAAILLASFCVTNLEAAAGFLSKVVSRIARPAGIGAVAMAVGVILACALVAGWQSYQLLAGPAVATLAIYLITLCSGLRSGGRLLTLALAVPLVLLVLTTAATLWRVTS
jgi:hypothetical protein